MTWVCVGSWAWLALLLLGLVALMWLSSREEEADEASQYRESTPPTTVNQFTQGAWSPEKVQTLPPQCNLTHECSEPCLLYRDEVHACCRPSGHEGWHMCGCGDHSWHTVGEVNG